MFRKDMSLSSPDTELPKRVIVTEWQAYARYAGRAARQASGVPCVSWPALEPLNPMLRGDPHAKHVARKKGPYR
jgi:hypothetical protein